MPSALITWFRGSQLLVKGGVEVLLALFGESLNCFSSVFLPSPVIALSCAVYGMRLIWRKLGLEMNMSMPSEA